MHVPLYNKGITLIETIVAVTILAVAIAGPMTLAASSLRATRDARSELIATHLAEEGVEIVHNIRDNNVTNNPLPGSWLANILPNCGGFGCVVDVTAFDPATVATPAAGTVWSASAATACPAADCSSISRVYYNPNTGLYRQSAAALTSPWTQTLFYRTIIVTGVDNVAAPLRQAHIVVTVTYRGYGAAQKVVTIDDDVYNWFPPLH